MVLNKKDINRLVIYFFYDADGIVDRYVPYMLEEMKKNSSEIFVVVNGKLTPEGRDIFKKITSKVFVRDNVGFDVWAYKEAMEQYGWDKLAEFDEVVLMNHTIMGPVYPFSEMFEEMNKRDLDFWGLTVYHKQTVNPYNICYGYIPEHIQSHFIVVRNSLITSMEFHNYWDNRPLITRYEDAVGQHEAIFTKHFADLGFAWDKYIDTDDVKDFTGYPLMWCPIKLITEKRCPIFKRRMFFHNYIDTLDNINGSEARNLIKFLRDRKLYDVDLIFENIIRSYNMADIKNSLNLSWILPKSHSNLKNTNSKIALVIHIYFDDLIDYCYNYALSMPKTCDIIITTDKEEKAKAIEKKFKEGSVWNNVIIMVIENRGRDVSSLLVAAEPYIMQYDYICFAHDKKVTQLDAGIKGYYFSERCFENVLGSKEYVQNIIERFDSDPFLGMLCPPPPNCSDYYSSLGLEWGINYENTKKLYDKLKLKSPIDINKEPIAPLGTMFWFRAKAMKKLLEPKWQYTDFPKEPNSTDGTLLHAIERIYPFVIQDAGYYCAWCLNDDYAQSELTDLSYMLRNINTRLFAMYGAMKYNTVIFRLDYELGATHTKTKPISRRQYKFKSFCKKITPKPIWNFMKKIYHKLGGKRWVG